MFGYDKIDLTFTINPVFFVLSLLIVVAYTIFVYRFTIPPVSKLQKTILIILRSLAIIALILLIFEPILTLVQNKIIQPEYYVFVDNSRSIKIEDGTNREESIRNFVEKLKNSSISNISGIYTFGNNVNGIDKDSTNKIQFDEGTTNFSNIFSYIGKKNEQNISSILIVSDGVITEGAKPTITASKTGVPVFTVGIGDSTKRNDVAVKNVLYNEFIYAETPTTILATLTNKGFANKNISVSLYEGNSLIDQQNITLNKDGLQNIKFNFTPQTGGEKRLTIIASELDGEFTNENNRKVYYINVLSNKISVLVLSGSPSSDLSFVINALKQDKNLDVNSIVQIGSTKFLKEQNNQTLLDSADILFLIGFPSANTSSNLINNVKEEIKESNKPFFITLSTGTDINKLLQNFQEELSFTISDLRQDYFQVQPYISADQFTNPIIQNNAEDPVVAWNNAPPVLQQTGDYKVKPESKIISTIKVNNVPANTPLILSKNIGNNRSISILADNIWKWKLQTATKDYNLFDSFIQNSVRWLNTSNQQKQVVINTSKRSYSSGEPVEFTAQVYDEAFNPVSDAEVNVNIKNQDQNFEVLLSSAGNGLYEGTFQTNLNGDFTFSGSAIRNEKTIGKDFGRFNIGELDIEMIDPSMNYNFLSTLSNQTGGKYYSVNNIDKLFERINKLNSESSKEKIIVNEIKLWASEWLMVVIILLFAFEWFLRKRAGML